MKLLNNGISAAGKANAFADLVMILEGETVENPENMFHTCENGICIRATKGKKSFWEIGALIFYYQMGGGEYMDKLSKRFVFKKDGSFSLAELRMAYNYVRQIVMPIYESKLEQRRREQHEMERGYVLEKQIGIKNISVHRWVYCDRDGKMATQPFKFTLNFSCDEEIEILALVHVLRKHAPWAITGRDHNGELHKKGTLESLLAA